MLGWAMNKATGGVRSFFMDRARALAKRAALDEAMRELLARAGRYEQQVRVEVGFEGKEVLISLVGDEPKKWHFDARGIEGRGDSEASEGRQGAAVAPARLWELRRCRRCGRGRARL